MKKVSISKQFFFIPHELFNGTRHGIQHRVIHVRRELFCPLFDDDITGVTGAINRMTKTHNFIFALQHTANAFRRFFW